MKSIHTAFLLAAFIISFSTAASAVSVEQMNSIPLAFTLNEGQADHSIRFTARGSGCVMAFSPEGTTFLLSRETAASVAKRAAKKSVVFADDPTRDRPEYEGFALKLAFVGANGNPEITGEDRLPWNSNYFFGNDPDKWRTDVPNYRKVRLKEVYKGIDLVYYGNRKRVKYDFVVKPGEDPERILLKYDFGEAGGDLAVNEKGELVVKTPVGELIEEKPYCYQKIAGKEVEVAVRYEVVEGGTYRFLVGAYDTRYDLVIDPEMVYSTYLGGKGDDYAMDMAVDDSGCAYVTGYTGSNEDFPITAGAYDPSFETIFVSKLNPNGTALLYSTFFAANDSHSNCSIAVDRFGNACIAGFAGVSGIPITDNAIDKQPKGGDAFITKFNFMGNGLIFSTYFGGSEMDNTASLVLDDRDDIYITGFTFSPDFPTTGGAYKEKSTSVKEVFVTKLNSTASQVLYSTVVGDGEATEIQVDPAGEVCITGDAYAMTYPLTENAFDTARRAGYRLFVTKLNRTLSGLVYSTLLGGSSLEYFTGLALDSSGCAYVCGLTRSADFPTTPGAFLERYNDNSYGYGFVSKFSPDGGRLVYSTYIGGKTSAAAAEDIVVDEKGRAVITGGGGSFDYPTTPDAFQQGNKVGHIILTVFSEDGSALRFSTCWGGSSTDEVLSIAQDGIGNIYIAGRTSSIDFPLSPGAIDDYNPQFSGVDSFITKFSMGEILSGVSSDSAQPSEFRITSFYPNPFNPSTTIEFSLPEPGKVTMTVYSVTGQKVYEEQTGRLSKGIQRIRWNGRNSSHEGVSSGVYVIQLNNGRQSIAQKSLLLK